MAIPLIVPALFSLASAGANYMGQKRAADARNDALQAERIRQASLDREAEALNVQSQDRYADAPEKQDERSGELAEMFKESMAAQPAVKMPAMPSSDNVAVQDRAETASSEARAASDQRAEALGEFRGFGDLFGELGREQARDASQIGQIGSFKRGSQGVLPMELTAAAEEGGGARMLGDLFGLGASMTMGPALGGADMPGGGFLSGLFGGGGGNVTNAAGKAVSGVTRPVARPPSIYGG